MENGGDWPGSTPLHDLFDETGGDQGNDYPSGAKVLKARKRFVARGGVARTVVLRRDVWHLLCDRVAKTPGLDRVCLELIRGLSLKPRDGFKQVVSGDEIGWQMASTDAFPNLPIINVYYMIENGRVDVLFATVEPNRFEVRETPEIQTGDE